VTELHHPHFPGRCSGDDPSIAAKLDLSLRIVNNHRGRVRTKRACGRTTPTPMILHCHRVDTPVVSIH